MPADAEVTAGLEHVAAHAAARSAPRSATSACRRSASSRAVNRVILQSEAWAIHGPWLRERPGDYGQLARRRLMAGAFMSAGDYVQAARRRLEMIAAVEDALRDVDVLLCASAMDPPSRIDNADRGRAHLSAAGAHAVQRHRPPGARDDGRSFVRRSAAIGAVRRPLLRRSNAVPSRAGMGARGGDRQ